MKVRLAILGSCVSRDPFAFFPDDRFEITRFVARTSIVGFVAKPLKISADYIMGLNNFESRCIYEDFCKSYRDLLGLDFDFLIIDFVEERFDIAKIGDTFVTCSPNVVNSGVLSHYPDHEIINRVHPEIAFVWASAWLQFVQLIQSAGIAHKVILNCGVYCKTYEEESEIRPFDKNYMHFAEQNTLLINSYHGLAKATLLGLREITVDSKWHIAAKAHKWGLQPFHYTNQFYADFMDKLCATIGLK